MSHIENKYGFRLVPKVNMFIFAGTNFKNSLVPKRDTEPGLAARPSARSGWAGLSPCKVYVFVYVIRDCKICICIFLCAKCLCRRPFLHLEYSLETTSPGSGGSGVGSGAWGLGVGLQTQGPGFHGENLIGTRF